MIRRLHPVTACSSSPDSWPAWWSPAGCAPRRIPARTHERARPPSPRATRQPHRARARGAAPRRPAPDFTQDRRTGGERRGQHLVAAGRPQVEFAVRKRSVLPVLLRRPGRCSARAIAARSASAPASSSPPTATSSPTTTSSARTSARSRRACRTSARCKGKHHRHRSGDRHRAAENRRQGTAGRAWGDSSKLQGRRVGAGDRQPVSAQSDGHRRHRQRDRPRQRRLRRLRGLHPDRRGDQSRATPAAR